MNNVETCKIEDIMSALDETKDILHKCGYSAFGIYVIKKYVQDLYDKVEHKE